MFRAPVFVLVVSAFSLHSAETDALALGRNIVARHLPFGTVLNPIFAADGATIAGYTRCGDSALWTGHYLAAEAFRYAVTRSADALANARTAVAGLTLLTDITGTDVLARCAVPADSPFEAGIAREEAANGVHSAVRSARQWVWIGNTSRDQYTGVFFGLGAAYDLVDDAALRADMAAVATRLLNNLLAHGWSVTMPDGTAGTTFWIRPDEELALLQAGQHLNAAAFANEFARNASLAYAVGLPLSFDAANNQSSYFKFNLAFDSLYNLIRLETDSGRRTAYEAGFAAVRAATFNHLNAHFNMIDRALHGPNGARDAETRADLDQWLLRPRTDVTVDWRGKVAACGNANEACTPLPVAGRPPSDFLWQLDPYQLSGGGSGAIETAGIDYILPYWMARYYGVIASPARGHFHRPVDRRR